MLFHCGTLLIDIRRRIDPFSIDMSTGVVGKAYFQTQPLEVFCKKGVLKNFANFTECLF